MSLLRVASTIEDVKELIAHCKKTGYASFDFETTGLEYYEKHNKPLCLGVSFQPGSSWVIPLAHKDSPMLKNKVWVKALKLFGREVLENWDIVKIAWNLKFEYKWCLRYGIKCRGRLFDAQLAKYCLDEERPNDLKSWVQTLYPQYGGYEDKINKGANAVPWAEKPLDDLMKYCGIDADLTGRIMNYFEGRLIKLGFYNLFRNLLMMATRVLAESEFKGMVIDREYLLSLMASYKIKITEAEKALNTQPALMKFIKKNNAKIVADFILKEELEIQEIRKNNAPNAARLIANRETKISNYRSGVFTAKEQEKLGGLNWKSPQQVIDFFYKPITYQTPKGAKQAGTKFGLKMTPKLFTDSGAPSTSEEALELLRPQDKTGVIDALLTFRGLEHLNKIYIQGMYDILGSDDRVHANFKVFGTVTGRISCEKPNLQNIPRGCIEYNTPILTNEGWRIIGDFIPPEIGTYRLPGDIKVKTHTGEYRRITHGVNKGKQEMFEVELDNGTVVTCTKEHKFLTPRGWRTLTEILKNNLEILIDETVN